MEWLTNYSPVPKDFWTGRVDDINDPDSYRWHQRVKIFNLRDIKSLAIDSQKKAFCIIGFSCDKGVEKNLGRTGTALGPFSIRKELANLPDIFGEDTLLFDAGNIHCLDGNLENAQLALSQITKIILDLGIMPIVLGGGHEIAFGHYNGLKNHLNNKSKKDIGIINFDAHFDLRPYENGASSGTMFRQIADQCKTDKSQFSYFALGIQRYGNTKSLFKIADELKADYILAKDIYDANWGNITRKIDAFTEKHNNIYMTICTDVFSSAVAPGVSAPQPFGLNPDITMRLIKHVIRTKKVISFDIAEVSPRFDDDNQTAKLASVLIYGIINTILHDDI